MYKVEVVKLISPVSPDVIALSGTLLLIVILLIAIAHTYYMKTRKK